MSIEKQTVELLKSKKLKLATAESCTGGLISKRITDVSGSSEVFEGGVVCYSNRFKENVLGVPPLVPHVSFSPYICHIYYS